ncbi:PH domain-containing protein [Pradoshia sp.]
MYFPSKKDWWMTIIIWLFVGLFIIFPVFFEDAGVWMTPEFLDKQWIKIMVLFPIGFVLMWMWFKTGYRIEDQSLIIQSGPFKKKIFINEIYKIRETKNPFTAAALSMDKIEIYYAKYGVVAISPENKTAFVHQLRKQNVNITLE